MPIVTLQRQMRQIGRIRAGNRVVSKGGKLIPNKLETWRLTSSSREMIEAAVAAYGGRIQPWDNNGSAEFEVITEATTIPIVVPPGQIVSQWMELWSGGGCLRRCDGEVEQITQTPCGSIPTNVGDKTIPPCPQDVPSRILAAGKGAACKATTRLNVILPELPDFGLFMLESHGHYAAVEIAGAADILAMSTRTGQLIPARLRLEQREKKVPGQPPQKYGVPIIEFIETTFASLGITAGDHAPARQIAAGGPPALPAIAAPVTSDFRAPEPPTDAPLVGEVIDSCGWSLAPIGDGPVIPCTFGEMHAGGHSWKPQAQANGGRVVPPAE